MNIFLYFSEVDFPQVLVESFFSFFFTVLLAIGITSFFERKKSKKHNIVILYNDLENLLFEIFESYNEIGYEMSEILDSYEHYTVRTPEKHILAMYRKRISNRHIKPSLLDLYEIKFNHIINSLKKLDADIRFETGFLRVLENSRKSMTLILDGFIYSDDIGAYVLSEFFFSHKSVEEFFSEIYKETILISEKHSLTILYSEVNDTRSLYR